MSVLRIATRASRLARTQASSVAAAFERAHPGVATTLVEITTTGDLDTESPVAALTEIGAFVRAVQKAVLDGRADVAVHSCKDLPVTGPSELSIVYPERASPWDVLVGSTLTDLPEGARVGTGSPRRSSQLALLRPDLDIAEIRGNVDTRIDKVRKGEYAAIVVAEAGLSRLGRADEVAHRFSVDEMVPAPAQGALAVEAVGDGPWWEPLQALDDPVSRAGVEIEREVLRRTGAGCRSALGATARMGGDDGWAVAFVDDGSGPRRTSASGATGDALVARLIAQLGLST